MGMSVSPHIWQQFVDLVFQDDLIKRKQNFDVIMDDTFIHSTAEEHMDDLMDLFKVLRKYGLKLSPHKCQFFKKNIVYMGLEFQIQEDRVCYTPLERSRNLDRSFRNIYIIPSFPTREQHAHSVQNARSRFTKLNQSYSC